MMNLIKENGTYACYGYDYTDDDGRIVHYRELRIDNTVVASRSWKAGGKGIGFERLVGDKYAQYKARCYFDHEWHH